MKIALSIPFPVGNEQAADRRCHRHNIVVIIIAMGLSRTQVLYFFSTCQTTH